MNKDDFLFFFFLAETQEVRTSVNVTIARQHKIQNTTIISQSDAYFPKLTVIFFMHFVAGPSKQIHI